MRALHSIPILLSLTILPSVVHAGARSNATKAMEKEAKTACMMGDYKKGTELLVKLFVESNEPVFIYNQARCFEQNHRWEEGLDRFREYLRKAKQLSATDKADVEQHIAECESHLVKAAPPPVTPPPPPVTPPPPVEPVKVDPVVPVDTGNTKPAPVANPGGNLKLAGIITGGAGLGMVGLGIFCNVKNEDTINKLKNPALTVAQRNTLQKDSDTYTKWGWIGYGVGAAAIVTGVTLYILGAREDSAASGTVALVPIVVPNGSGLLLQGTF